MMHRRQFLTNTTACSAHLLSLAAFAPKLLANAMAPQEASKVVAEESFGRLEEVEKGVWALISTPFDKRDFTTVCNGGIIQGEKGVLAIESFMEPKGATWLAQKAKKLTGKWPTDVVSTHYHGDHSTGHSGYFVESQNPRMWLTESTRAAAEASFKKGGNENNFKNVSTIAAKEDTEIDLGKRKVKLTPRSGHTSSDVTIEIEDPKVLWCGDLFFNRMFPNYGDAVPSKLKGFVESLIDQKDVSYVPGHGPIAGQPELKKYKSFLQFVEAEAGKAFKAGKPANESAKEFKLSKEFDQWFVWSPENAQRAFQAWYREWESAEEKTSSKSRR